MIGNERARAALLIIMIVAIVFALAYIFKQRAEGQITIPLSTLGVGPSGTKAFYLTTQRLGFRASRWRRPFTDMPEKGTIVVFNPLIPVDGKSWDTLVKFMRSGGRVLWVSNRTVLIEGVGTIRAKKALGKAEPVRTTRPTSIGLQLQGRTFRSKARLEGDLRNAVTHVGDEHGALLLSTRVGKGRLTAVADPKLATNSALRKDPGNIRLFLAALGPPAESGALYFDEWHHGLISPELPKGDIADLPIRVWGALPLWIKILLAQSALIIAAWFYSQGKRFGPPLPAGGNSAPASDYIGAMADLHRRAGSRRLVGALVYRQFIQAVTGRPGRGTADEEELVVRLAKRRSLTEDDVRPLIHEYRGAIEGRAEMSEGELVTAVGRLDRLREELRQHG